MQQGERGGDGGSTGQYVWGATGSVGCVGVCAGLGACGVKGALCLCVSWGGLGAAHACGWRRVATAADSAGRCRLLLRMLGGVVMQVVRAWIALLPLPQL